MSIGRPPPAAPPANFPKSAAEFMYAIEELFRYQHPFYVMEQDVLDGTFRIEWVDRSGKFRQSWVTKLAISELTRDWTWH